MPASNEDIRTAFYGQTTSTMGDALGVVPVLKGGPAHESFLKDYVGKVIRIPHFVRSLVFTGKGRCRKLSDTEAANGGIRCGHRAQSAT